MGTLKSLSDNSNTRFFMVSSSVDFPIQNGENFVVVLFVVVFIMSDFSTVSRGVRYYFRRWCLIVRCSARSGGVNAQLPSECCQCCSGTSSTLAHTGLL